MRKLSFFITLLIAIVTITGLALARQTAQADCPDGTADPDDITCTGTDTDGSYLDDGDDTLVVEEGAVVEGVEGAIDGGAGDDVIENNGTINTEGTAIYGSCDNDTLTNNGEINAGGIGLDGACGDDTLTNNGTINADNEGMMGGSGSDTLVNNGTINGVYETGMLGDSRECSEAEYLEDVDTLINNGEITVQQWDGMADWCGDVTFTNTGTVTSGYDAIYQDDENAQVTITNSGTLHSVPGEDDSSYEAVYTNGATTLTNSGSIISDDEEAINTSRNADYVTNTGTIIGHHEEEELYGDLQSSVFLDAGNDTMVNEAGAEIVGVLDGGEDDGCDPDTTECSENTERCIECDPNDFDTLIFTYTFEAEDFFIPAEFEAMQNTIANAPVTGCPCTLNLVVNGVTFTYTHINFEKLSSELRWIQIQKILTEIKATFAPYEDMNCKNGVKCFALKTDGFNNGNVQIYAAENSQGTPVATVNFLLLGASGYTYTNPDTGWTVTITYIGTSGDALLYTITISKDGDVRQAMIEVMAFQFNDANPNTNALAWQYQ